MSKVTEKKFRKLRKARIWPSIVFFLLFLWMVLVAFCTFVGLMIENQLNERNTSAINNAFSLMKSLDALQGQEEDLLKDMEANGTIPEGIFIYDKQGKLIAGHGEKTYIEESAQHPGNNFSIAYAADNKDEQGLYQVYMDKDSDFNFYDKNGKVDQNAVFENVKKISGLIDPETHQIHYTMKFWICSDLSGNRKAFIKCIVDINTEDYKDAVTIASSVAGLLACSALFFFINVLISISNQRRMTQLIYTDPVTGGKSYLFYENHADKILRKKRNMQIAIADITIMKYRSFRNFHGTKNSEALLEDVDREITQAIRKREICAHSGKSSFVVLIQCLNRKEGEERLNALLKMLSMKFSQCGIVFHGGVYFYENEKNMVKSDSLAADCLSRASAARATLTDENVSALAVYEDKILEDQKWVHKVEEKMQKALDNEEFKVFIQPKYNPVTEELAGGEALIRWINDEDGFISPGRFIPIFESNGFIMKIDDYMISHVAKLQSEWIREGKNVVPISVNVSRAHFANPNLAEHICSLVDAYEVPHNLIELELTESAFFDDKAALLRTVHKLQDMGFEISMDDFGAGYSSLNSLKDLPLDVLKLDAEFFRGEDGENRMEIVVSQAIKLAKCLDMRIVAEGVEKKEQVDFLAGQGCDMIQGFYYAKPMPAEEYAERVKSSEEKSSDEADGTKKEDAVAESNSTLKDEENE